MSLKLFCVMGIFVFLLPSFAQMVFIDNYPDVYQSCDYSCGASSLKSALLYWNKDHWEADLMEMLGTNSENGTCPVDMVRVARELGCKAELYEQMSLESLKKMIDKKFPVIICAQAWEEGKYPEKNWANIWDCGHYMVVIGYDNTSIYLEDPCLLGAIAYIPQEEFMARWHSYDGWMPSEKKYFQMGIVIVGETKFSMPKFFRLE